MPLKNDMQASLAFLITLVTMIGCDPAGPESDPDRRFEPSVDPSEGGDPSPPAVDEIATLPARPAVLDPDLGWVSLGNASDWRNSDEGEMVAEYLRRNSDARGQALILIDQTGAGWLRTMRTDPSQAASQAVGYFPGDMGTAAPGSVLSPVLVGTRGSAEHSGPEGSLAQDVKPKPLVFGDDSLTVEFATTDYPYRTNGGITTSPVDKYGNTGSVGGESPGGSGTMIGPRHIVTAGHVLYDPEKDAEFWHWSYDEGGGYKAWFRPGQSQNGNSTDSPFGTPMIVAAGFPIEYYTLGDKEFDAAIAVLEDWDSLPSIGWQGLCFAEDSKYLNGSILALHGYPGQDDFCKHSPEGENKPCGYWQYYDSETPYCKISDVKKWELRYVCDTHGGMSGAGLWAYPEEGPGPCVWATHQGGVPFAYNHAFRYNKTWVTWMIEEVICHPDWDSSYATYSLCP